MGQRTEKDHSMIETRHLRNFLNFLLSSVRTRILAHPKHEVKNFWRFP